jgi:hypothetical protein
MLFCLSDFQDAGFRTLHWVEDESVPVRYVRKVVSGRRAAENSYRLH